MKTEEDEAFDDLAKRQGDWGGGFMAKRAMAVDKLQEPVLDLDGHVVRDARKPKKAALAYIAPPKREWVGLTEQERNNIEDDFSVVISIHVFDAIEQALKEKNNGT